MLLVSFPEYWDHECGYYACIPYNIFQSCGSRLWRVLPPTELPTVHRTVTQPDQHQCQRWEIILLQKLLKACQTPVKYTSEGNWSWTGAMYVYSNCTWAGVEQVFGRWSRVHELDWVHDKDPVPGWQPSPANIRWQRIRQTRMLWPNKHLADYIPCNKDYTQKHSDSPFLS